jgi:hypothetical protein
MENPVPETEAEYQSVPPENPNRGSGRATIIVLGVVVLVGVLVGLFFLLDIGGDEEEAEATPTAQVNIIPSPTPQPVPIVAMTPIMERIATLEANELVKPEELEAIREQIEQLDADSVTNEQLTNILSQLETQFGETFIDSEELQAEINTLLESEGFGQTVLDIVNQANAQATQTQEAIDCFVEALPEYTTVRVYAQPAEGAERVDFIQAGRKYRVLARTDGAINTVTLWWQIEFDPTNNIRPWVRSDLVLESDEDKCLAIAIR